MTISAKFLSFIISISFSSSGQILQKIGVLNLGLADFEFSSSNLFSLIIRMLNNYWLLGGIFFMGLTLLSYLLILSKTNLSSFYPVFVSGTIIFVAIGSRIFLNETLSSLQIFGIFIIIIGIFLMFFGQNKIYGRH